MLRFREHNRYFQVHIALGPAASAPMRHAVVAVLNSLVIKPR
jgi:hypothetical protein